MPSFGHERIVLANLMKKTIEELFPLCVFVRAFLKGFSGLWKWLGIFRRHTKVVALYGGFTVTHVAADTISRKSVTHHGAAVVTVTLSVTERRVLGTDFVRSDAFFILSLAIVSRYPFLRH